MSEIIKRDQNHVTVGAGVSNDVSQDIVMLRVDSITKELLVSVSSDGTPSGTVRPIAQRDQNHKPVCLAWDATNQQLQEILTDASGNLLCDVEFI